jgi:hypothetical protein
MPANLCQGLVVTCSGKKSCPNGNLCCAKFPYKADGGIDVETSCAQQCPNEQLCDTNSDCPLGEHCVNLYAGIRGCD